MAYTLVYHPEVKTKDVPKLNRDVAKRIQRAVENRLAVEPQRYGEPLRRTLKGYWKLRVGDYRVVFKIVRNEVWIFAIMHRRDVYQRIEARLAIQ
jgi:mRNA interferase RelE/StbE